MPTTGGVMGGSGCGVSLSSEHGLVRRVVGDHVDGCALSSDPEDHIHPITLLQTVEVEQLIAVLSELSVFRLQQLEHGDWG